MNKKDILIVCALEEETNGKLDGYNVIYTGVGKVNATYELTAELLFQQKLAQLDVPSKFPQLVINFGTAGSRDIPIHTLVACTKFIQRDMDATGLGFFKGQTPFEKELLMDFSYLPTFTDVNDYVCGSGDNFVENIDNEIDHIDIFDMEAYALAKVCSKIGIEFISYKYITDNVDEESANDWKENCNKGIKEFKKLLKKYY